jgi:HlyD family secretion protein
MTLARARPRLSLGLGTCIVVLLLLAFVGRSGDEASALATVARVERGPLLIAITESGTIRAKDNLEVKCEVEGRSTITFIVEEGTRVEEGDLLVELESSQLEERFTQMQMSYEDAKASFANARAQFDITRSKNQSNTDKALQDLMFAQMDLARWLGQNPESGPPPQALESEETGGDQMVPAAPASPEEPAELAVEPSVERADALEPAAGYVEGLPSLQDDPLQEEVDDAMARLAELARLDVGPKNIAADGEFSEEEQKLVDERFEELQRLIDKMGGLLEERLQVAVGEGEHFKLQQQALSNISLALGSLSQAYHRLRWTVRLTREGHASYDELTTDELSAARAQANLVAAILDYRLSRRYSWPKDLVSLRSTVREAERELERVKSQADASLAQAQAELNKREKQLELQERELREAEEQLSKARVTAPKAGLVVYPRVQSYRGSEQLLEVGAQVNQRQVLVTLPDLSELIVDTKVYESEVNRVRVGQRALVRVQALAQVVGEGQAPVLEGRVSRIAMLPDYGNRWLNPDQKTFNVEVTVDESREEIRSTLKPEMTSEVSIVLAELPDALHVPVQAVARVGDQTVCYLPGGANGRPVPVRVGLTNTTRAEIISGLEEGDQILLAPPIGEEATAQALGIPGVEVEATEGREPAAASGSAEEQPAAASGFAEEQPAAGEGAAAGGVVEEAPAPEAEVNIDEVLSRLPTEARDRMRERWESASPEERQQMLLRFQRRGPGGGPPGGRPDGGGRRPREQ